MKRKTLIERIKSHLPFFTEDGQRVRTLDTYSWFNSLFGLNSTYQFDTQNLVNQSYGSNPYFFMVIDRIANLAASLPRELIDVETGKPLENPSREAQQLEMLLETPNPAEGEQDFYYRLGANLLLGNLYVYKELPAGFNRGLPSMLLSPISPDVTINDTESGLSVESYSFTYLNQSFNDVPPEQVLHLKRPNIIESTHYGLSTVKPSAPVWATSNEIFRSGYALHRNKGIQGIMFGKGSTIMRPDEQKQLQDYYNKAFGNSEHMGKVKIASTEVGYIPMGVNPADLQSVEMNLDLLRATCAIFGVASQLFGDVAASTYSNMEQAERAMYMNAVLPLARRIDKALNYWLVGNQNYCYKVNETQIALVQDVKADLTDNAISLYNAGLITLQEARLMVNEDFEIVPDELLNNQQQAENVNTENDNEDAEA